MLLRDTLKDIVRTRLKTEVSATKKKLFDASNFNESVDNNNKIRKDR